MKLLFASKPVDLGLPMIFRSHAGFDPRATASALSQPELAQVRKGKSTTFRRRKGHW